MLGCYFRHNFSRMLYAMVPMKNQQNDDGIIFIFFMGNAFLHVKRESYRYIWGPIVNRIDFRCKGASVIKHAYARDKKLTNDISKEKDDLFDWHLNVNKLFKICLTLYGFKCWEILRGEVCNIDDKYMKAALGVLMYIQVGIISFIFYYLYSVFH